MKIYALTLTAATALTLAACGDNKTADPNAVANAGPIEPIPAPNGGDWTQTVVETPEGGFLMGNPDAPVKLVEFGAQTCSHCRDFDEQGVKPLIDTYVKSGRVSYEFRSFLLNGLDLSASLISRCNGPSSFFGLTRQLYADQPEWVGKVGEASPAELQQLETLPPTQKVAKFAELAGLKQWATMRGIPASKVDACLADQTQIDKLVAMTSDATSSYEIQGTPSFLLNGELVELEGGTPVWTQIEAKLRETIG